MPEEQFQPRQIAYKIKIGDLNKGEYIEQEGWQPNFIRINEKQVSRVNVIASVVDKEVGDNLGTLTIDDGSGDIQVRAFKEESAKLNDINIGDIILVIGRPRKYGNRFFISYEIVKKLDPLWAKVRQKELEVETNISSQTNTLNQENIVEDVKGGMTGSIKNEEKNKISENKKIILNLIRNIDNGDGANIEDVKINSKIDAEKAEEIIQELIKNGEIYENIAGRVKLL